MAPTANYSSIVSLKRLGYKSLTEKLHFAAIGAGRKGYSDIKGYASENWVAMVDPDNNQAARTFNEFPNVPKYKDRRRMFDRHEREIDAVLVSTPDHVHAKTPMWAMVRGKHVYGPKPLTRTYWEAEQLSMPPVTLSRHRLTKQPEIEGVRAGELLGDSDCNRSLVIAANCGVGDEGGHVAAGTAVAVAGALP